MGTAAEAAQMFEGVAARLADMTPIMEVVAANVRLEIDDAFQKGASPEGVVWRGLSHTTEQINPRRAGGKPLNDTLRLRRSITTKVGPRGLSFGTNVVYAGAQNFGNPGNRVFGKTPGPVPARQFLLVSPSGLELEPDSFWDHQVEIIERWILTGEVTQ
jgi:phage gpG-like protein